MALDREPAILEFSRQCFRVASAVAAEIRSKYPTVPVLLTVGDLELPNERKPRFEFNEEIAIRCAHGQGPHIFPGHTWITLGTDYIVDLTIGTWIVINSMQRILCGGIVHGQQEDLRICPIDTPLSEQPLEFADLRYTPVIVGDEAVQLVCRKPLVNV